MNIIENLEKEQMEKLTAGKTSRTLSRVIP